LSVSKHKHKHKHRRPHGTPPAAPNKQAILDELATRASEIDTSEPEQTGPLWGAVHKLLLKTEADPSEVARLVTTRDKEALHHLLRALSGVEEDLHESGDVQPVPEVPPETLKKALRAFRKRVKLIRLDHESRLGVGPMTGGRKADFDAILPPQEYGPEVWEALAEAGRLRRAGQGFYMLPETDGG
jgi:hypothetical protein